jgi:hypothetical protein
MFYSSFLLLFKLQNKDFKGLELSLASFQEPIGLVDVYKQTLASFTHPLSTRIIQKKSWTERQI